MIFSALRVLLDKEKSGKKVFTGLRHNTSPRENGISARGFLARGILAHICARTPRVRNPCAEILYPRVRGRGAKFVICAEIPQVVT